MFNLCVNFSSQIILEIKTHTSFCSYSGNVECGDMHKKYKIIKEAKT